MILGLGALVAFYERWLRAGPRAAVPFALATGSVGWDLGAGFGAWALAAATVLVVIVVAELHRRRQALRHALTLGATGVILTVLCALPTLLDLSGSVQVARNIASTSNPGNLRTP